MYLSQTRAGNGVLNSDVENDDDRLLMSWADGARRSADLDLLNAAKIATDDKVKVMHCFPRQLEQELKEIERDFADKPSAGIRRTVFSVRPKGC